MLCLARICAALVIIVLAIVEDGRRHVATVDIKRTQESIRVKRSVCVGFCRFSDNGNVDVNVNVSFSVVVLVLVNLA